MKIMKGLLLQNSEEFMQELVFLKAMKNEISNWILSEFSSLKTSPVIGDLSFHGFFRRSTRFYRNKKLLFKKLSVFF